MAETPREAVPRLRPIFVAYIVIAFLLFSAPLLLRTLNARDQIRTRRGVIKVPERTR